jgi:hypothetical protein
LARGSLVFRVLRQAQDERDLSPKFWFPYRLVPNAKRSGTAIPFVLSLSKDASSK